MKEAPKEVKIEQELATGNYASTSCTSHRYKRAFINVVAD
jgi:hypothetical protein